jgi:EAL domain-containing protein (putative c-di-GMP-specific phosphodiesterase class I)
LGFECLSCQGWQYWLNSQHQPVCQEIIVMKKQKLPIDFKTWENAMQFHEQDGKENYLLDANGEMGFNFSFAFQPIVDVQNREIISFEALVRGPHGESSASVFAQVPKNEILKFDKICRHKAIHLASRLKIPNQLNLNLAAESIYEIDLSIMATFQASMQSGFPAENIIFEVLESKSLTEKRNLVRYLRLIQEFGFATAIDDFGAGYSGLRLLAEYQPYFIKLDRHLIGNIHQDYVKQRIFAGIRKICDSLSIQIVAEGVESAGEYHWLHEAGIVFFQGYYFARPAFEALPDVANKIFYV